jgi:hypothetical protein
VLLVLTGVYLVVMAGLLLAVGNWLLGGNADAKDVHMALGSLAGLVNILMLATAAIGRLWRWAAFAAVLVVLNVVQHMLPSGPDAIASLHPLNAVVMVLLGWTLLNNVWAGRGAR